MMLTLRSALLIGAFICFCFATFGVPARVNWIGFGLALGTLSLFAVMTVEQLLYGGLTTLAAVILANHAGLWVSGREFKAMKAERDLYFRLVVRQLRTNRALAAAKGNYVDDDGDDGDNGELVA